MSQTLLEMAKDLVEAQIHACKLPPEDMHGALHITYATLHDLQSQEDARGSVTVEPSQPVNWRSSITHQTVTCLVCHARFKQLSASHLRKHGLDSRSYRQRWVKSNKGTKSTTKPQIFTVPYISSPFS